MQYRTRDCEMNWEGDWWFHQVGDTMGTWVVSAEDIVGEQRSDPSLAWLVPQQGFWSDDEVGEPPFLFGFSVLIFWVFFFTFLSGSNLAGAPARILSDDEVRAPHAYFDFLCFFWMLWASRDTRTWLTQPSDATPSPRFWCRHQRRTSLWRTSQNLSWPMRNQTLLWWLR